MIDWYMVLKALIGCLLAPVFALLVLEWGLSLGPKFDGDDRR